MDPRTVALLLLSLLSVQSKLIYGDSSVVFLDSPTHNFLRHSQDKITTLSHSEVGAAASVLLGVAPSSALTAENSYKLNEVLMPNPFDRPRALLLLEVTGVEGSQLSVHSDKSAHSNALNIKVVGNEPTVDIQLPDDNEVSLVSLNEISSDNECSDKEISYFTSWLGGSYIEDSSRPLNGELIIPLSNGALLRLHMSKKADGEFTRSLVLLINNIRRAIEFHEVLKVKERSPAELITGRFDGLKALQVQYGTEGIAEGGLEVFMTSISKMFDVLQTVYQGRIVGTILSDGIRSSESVNKLHLTVNPRPSARRLEETEGSPESKIAEVVFVRNTLAWVTGIILLIATLMGISFLLNMPLTKDTLLYANVKLD